MKKYLLISLALLISSCVHVSDESLVESRKDDAVVISSTKNYEEAYSIIAKQLKGCGRGSINLNEIAVTSSLDQQKQVGRISQTIKAPFISANHILVIDVTPSGSGSKISIYRRGGSAGAEEITKWLNGSNEC